MTDLVSNSGNGSSLDDQYAFVARIDNVKLLAQLLRAIEFRTRSTWFISSNGIKVTVEDAKCVQTNAFIKGEIFQEYNLRAGRGDNDGCDDLSFCVNLNVILECLNMFGGVGAGNDGISSQPTLKICYAGYGNPLILYLEEHGVITDCQINTREADECLDFNFANADIVSKIIMKSEHLKEVFSELDGTSDLVEFCVSPSAPHFKIATIGSGGDCSVEIPNNSDLVETFSCQAISLARYKLESLKHGIKPISLSEKVSIRMDSRDFLCLQYMVRTDEGPAFLEFYCAPEEETPDR